MLRASNASTMKEQNKRLILNLIRQNEYSRADLAKITKLTKAAVTIIVEALINDGLVSETKSPGKGIGRRPLILKLNENRLMAVGVNITRSFAEVGIADIGGNIICTKRLPSLPKEKVLEEIIHAIPRMIEENHIAAEDIYGIGVTTPGPVDASAAVILNPPNFDEWHYENIGLTFQGILDRKVYLENISGGLTLCEKYFGIAQKMDNFLVLIVDDGIGSGIMLSEKLFRHISELGHTSIRYDGIPCECGNFGCVEKYASIPAILRGTGYSSWKEVIDADDRKLIDKEARYLACTVINAVNSFSVENVILEGAVTYKPEELLNQISDRIKCNRIARKAPVLYSGSEYKGILCAAVTVFDNYLNK